MSRRTRNTTIAVALEATYGSTPGSYVPILLTGVPDFNIDPDVVPRDNVRGYYGASEELAGTRRSILKFTTELAGSSALGTAPAWGTLLRGCGFAETLTASTRVEYLPITQSLESLSMKFNRDGVQYLSRGGRGTGKFNMTAYDRPTIDWEFWGFDTAATVVAVGTPTLTAWQRPLVITDANSGNIKVGAAYAAGNVTGGTAYASRGMSIDIGNVLQHQKLLLNEEIDITDRSISGQMMLELDAAAEVAWRTLVNANTLDTLSFAIGAAAANVIAHGASVQRTKTQAVDYQGKLLIQNDLRYLPGASGNDDLRIIIK